MDSKAYRKSVVGQYDKTIFQCVCINKKTGFRCKKMSVYGGDCCNSHLNKPKQCMACGKKYINENIHFNECNP